MQYPTLLSLLGALFFLNLGVMKNELPTDTIYALNTHEHALNAELRETLAMDGLLASAIVIKIEFEYHDLFINEVIPANMEGYQQLLHRYGVQPGPQRQIHLQPDGRMLIGDFNGYGRMLGAAVRLAPKA